MMNRRKFIATALAIPAIIGKKSAVLKFELEPAVLKFEPIGFVAEDSQFIDQMKWSVEDIARAFRVPIKYIR